MVADMDVHVFGCLRIVTCEHRVVDVMVVVPGRRTTAVVRRHSPDVAARAREASNARRRARRALNPKTIVRGAGGRWTRENAE